MKNSLWLILCFGLLFVFGCQKALPPVDVDAEKLLIKSVLDNYVASVEKEDINLYGKCVAQDPDMVNFGSMGGPIIGWGALKQVMEGQNAALSETKIDARDIKIHVSADAKLGWVTCLWNLAAKMGENPISLPVRCTWILEKKDGGWTIIHFHKSVAMK